MTGTDASERDRLVLILMPTARDSERTRLLLTAAGLNCHDCQTWDEMCDEIRRGAGTALFAEESFQGDGEQCLEEVLKSQPAWSDFPLVVLARASESLRNNAFLQKVNILLVERPVKKRSLMSVVHAALRARHHQYAVRRHLQEREAQAEILIEKEARLNFALSAGRLGSWDLDFEENKLTCSPAFQAIFGRFAETEFTYQDLLDAIHPDDFERVRQAVAATLQDRTDYDVEYQILWPDGSLHWVLARGRVSNTHAGEPLRLTGVALDITSQKKAEIDLQDADRRKDEFLAMLAHELRNPLTPVRTGLELLALSGADPDSIGLMRDQVDHLVHLVDDLLDVARITRGKIQLRKEPVDVVSIAQRAIGVVRPLMESHRHILTVSNPPTPLWVDADPVRLTQIIANLLNNAAKYTPNHGEIFLTILPQNQVVSISVRDNGIGLEANLLPHVFDLFAQADQSLERSEGGLGIGLTLVKTLVEIHGGQVEARSGGTGQGSEFVVTLPLLNNYRPMLREVGQHDAGERRKILLVDDNVGTAVIQSKLLAKLGSHEVRAAYDGPSAIQAAIEMNPDIIFLDIGLPKMSGFEVAMRLRELPQFADTLLVALTGYGTEEDRRQSDEAGFDLHLVKPPSLESLRQAIKLDKPRRVVKSAIESPDFTDG